MEELEFKINGYMTLKLENNTTVIYINNEAFHHCKFLLIINPQENKELKYINSIDEADGYLSRKLEIEVTPKSLGITPEQEFWGHCSNMQVWAENDYDTRILHSNLAFPLLKKLTEVGDPQAKQVYKNEIAERFTSGYIPVSTFLINSGFLSNLDEEEKDIIFEDFEHILHDKNSCLIKPMKASVWVQLADALRGINKHTMALEVYEFALDMDPENIDAWNNRGVSFEQLGQYEKAIDSYSKAIDIDPEFALGWNNIGISAESLGNFDYAIEAYKRAIDIDPKYFEALNNLGYTYNMINEPDRGIEVLLKALEINEGYVDALNNLGISYFYKGYYENAKTHYKKALDINPQFHLAWSNLSEVYDVLGDHDKAMKVACEALKIEPNNFEAIFFYGHSQYKLGKLNDAIHSYLKALSLDSKKKKRFDLKDYRVWYSISKAYIKLGDYDNAFKACSRSLEDNPDFLKAIKLRKRITKRF